MFSKARERFKAARDRARQCLKATRTKARDGFVVLRDTACQRFIAVRDAFGPVASTILVLFSAVAVSLFVFGQLTQSTEFKVFGYDWLLLEQATQACIWFAFVSVFTVYSATSHRKFLNYAKKWWMEAIICVTWNPFGMGMLVTHMHSVFSLKTLLLIGTLAHVLRIAKWTASRFSQHAIVVIGVGTFSMVLVATALLMVVEPTTFNSFEETAYSVYLSALTIGPTSPPHTSAGRLVFALISTFGITTVALFVGVMREFVQRMFGHKDISAQLLQLLQAVLAGVQKLNSNTNEILLANLHSQQETIAILQAQLVSQQAQLSGQQATIELLQKELAKHDKPPPI